MKTSRYILATVVALSLVSSLSAESTAQQRLAAAAELQRSFDSSLVKNLGLKFKVRGDACDVLHVEGENLYDTMISGIANGTAIYGKVFPGGVTQTAFSSGFKDVVFTNRADDVQASYGSSGLTRAQVLKLRVCDTTTAATAKESAKAAPQPSPPAFAPLTRATATAGRELYDGSYNHVATIVSVDPKAGEMTVKYLKNGSVEPKSLDAIPKFYWYVRK
jgi:hypothetical protein